MIPAATIKEEPAGAARYLLPNEDCVAMVRRHPAVLLPASAYAVGGLLAAFIVSATLLRGHTTLILIIWALWGVLMVRLIWQAINWAVDYFVITSKRILLTSGVFTRSVAMMPLSKVTDMSFRRSLAGRLLGYGEFVVESAGQDQALRTIDHIPYPEDLYRRVCDEIFNQDTEKKGKEDKKGEVLQELDDFELDSEMIANRNPLPEVPEDTYLMDASDDPADEA
ncbi:MAG TPA: PH domain-containing protein [Streptosporangiaceae bacterium]|nr:PH domain-containing protein [Streptosporangiaceae bacterium]